MSHPAQVKITWSHAPLGRIGKWRFKQKQGDLGSVWEASGQWWAAANGVETSFRGGFPSSEAAIKWVEANATGIPRV